MDRIRTPREMRRLITALFVLIAPGALCDAAPQDDRIHLVGRIVDAVSLRPLSGAAVYVVGRDIVVRTDADGHFAIPQLAPGTYEIGARLGGYRPGDARVTVPRGTAPPRLEFALVPNTLRLAEEVAVTATRDEREAFDVPRSISVVPDTELTRTAPRTGAEALTRAPGVFVQKTNHGGGSPFVRGLVGNQVLVLVDGIRLNNSTFRYGPNQYLATVDPGTVDRFEVLRGSGSVQYGSDALGGVILVRNRDPLLSAVGTRPTAGLSGRLMSDGMEQALRLNLGVATPGAAVAGNVAVRNFGDLVAGGNLGAEAPSGYTETDADVRAVLMAGGSTTVTVAYDHVYQDDVPRFDQVAQRGYSRYAFDPQVRQFAFARIDQRRTGGWLDGLSLTTAWIRTRERRERQRAGSPLLTTEQDTVNTLAVTAEMRAVPLAGFTLVTGAEMYSDRVGSWRRDIATTTGASVEMRGLFPDGAGAVSAAGFGLATYRKGRLGADVGARYTWTSVTAEDAVFGNVEVSPGDWVGSGALEYKAAKGVSVYASASQGFRAPNLDDLSTLGLFDFGVEIPASQLQPERSLAMEAGTKLRTSRVAAALAVFRTNLSNLIDRRRLAAPPATLPFPGETRYYQRANVGQAFVRGIEAEAEWRLFPGTALFGHVAYAFGQNTTAGEPMRRIPPLNGLLGLRYDGAGGWWLQASVQAAGRQDRLAAADRDDHRIPVGGTPGWQVLDLFAGLPIGSRLTLSTGVLNLFDQAYRTHGSGIDGYGRSAWVGIDARF
jgi:hemoglobin/transferrin/lactoferrin receptor protein